MSPPLTCFSEEEERRLAHGWPYQVIIQDGGEVPPDRLALSAARGKTLVRGLWPREALARYLRLMVAVRWDRGALRTMTPAAKAALSSRVIPSADEVRSWLLTAFQSFTEGGDMFVLATEALCGTDETLEMVARGLELVPTEVTTDGAMGLDLRFPYAVAQTVPFLLLRASADATHATLSALREQSARFAEAARKHHELLSLSHGLELAAGGSRTVAAYFGADTCPLDYLDFGADDPAWVRRRLAEDPRGRCTVRAMWIAGEEGMKDLSERRFMPAELVTAMQDFGMVRSPETVRFALSLIGRSAAKDAPLQWLRSHAEYALPIVTAAARSSGPRAEVAKAALRGME